MRDESGNWRSRGRRERGKGERARRASARIRLRQEAERAVALEEPVAPGLFEGLRSGGLDAGGAEEGGGVGARAGGVDEAADHRRARVVDEELRHGGGLRVEGEGRIALGLRGA